MLIFSQQPQYVQYHHIATSLILFIAINHRCYHGIVEASPFHSPLLAQLPTQVHEYHRHHDELADKTLWPPLFGKNFKIRNAWFDPAPSTFTEDHQLDSKQPQRQGHLAKMSKWATRKRKHKYSSNGPKKGQSFGFSPTKDQANSEQTNQSIGGKTTDQPSALQVGGNQANATVAPNTSIDPNMNVDPSIEPNESEEPSLINHPGSIDKLANITLEETGNATLDGTTDTIVGSLIEYKDEGTGDSEESSLYVSQNRQGFSYNSAFNDSKKEWTAFEESMNIVTYLAKKTSEQIARGEETLLVILVRESILRAYRANEAVIIWDELVSEWAVCVWVETDYFSSFLHLDKMFLLRFCVPYEFLNVGSYPRDPVEYGDFIPRADMDGLRTMAQREYGTNSSLLSSKSIKESRIITSKNVTRIPSIEPVSREDVVYVNLFFLASDEYEEQCGGDSYSSEHCYAMCCYSVYMDSPFCANSYSCV